MPFEFDGKKYAQASAPQMEWGERLMAEFDLAGNERILDLGCGAGGLTAKLAELVPRGEVLGIDASQGMLEAAARHARENVRFQRLDILDADFADEFDLVFSNATLHWVLDHGRLLRNVLAALKPGGLARFNFGGDGNCIHYFQAVREAMAAAEFAPFFRDFTWPYYMPAIEEYQALVATIGFSHFEVWGEDVGQSFPDAAAITGWIDQPSIVPFLAQVDPSHKRAFRDTIVDKTIRATRQDDGTCFETFRRVNLRARK